MARRLIGGAAAVFIAPFVLWFYWSFLVDVRGTPWDYSFLRSCLVIGWPFAAVTMLLLGVPLLVLLEKRRWKGPLALATAGAIAGVAADYLMKVWVGWCNQLGVPPSPFNPDQLIEYALVAVTGAHCGLCYYAIAVRTWRAPRPNRAW